MSQRRLRFPPSSILPFLLVKGIREAILDEVFQPLLELYPTPETRPRQHEALIEIYRKGKIAEAFQAFNGPNNKEPSGSLIPPKAYCLRRDPLAMTISFLKKGIVQNAKQCGDLWPFIPCRGTAIRIGVPGGTPKAYGRVRRLIGIPLANGVAIL